MAAEHDELVAEMVLAERMPIVDRLKLAKKRRAQQLKAYSQYEKQLSKDTGKKTKKTTAESPKAKMERLRFAGSILILDAAGRNDVAEVRNLLDSGVSPDTCNEDGLTTLHQCCIDGLEEMMKVLLEHGANVNACDSERWTPLHAAATCCHVKLCKYLIDYGADLLAVNADGNMAYDLCEDGDTLDLIESEMAKRGVTQEMIDETRMSAESKMLADMQNLVNDGQSLEIRGPASETPMHVAACNGYLSVLEFLLMHGASVDVVDKDDWQPLHCAICWGQMGAVKVLLEHGADDRALTRNGETPLDLCDDMETKQAVIELIDEIQNNHPHDDHHSAEPHRRNSSVRRGSSGIVASHSLTRKASLAEKDTISSKDAREEAARFREMMQAAVDDDDEEEEVLEAITLPSPHVDQPTKPAVASPNSVNIWLPSPPEDEQPPSTQSSPAYSPAPSIASPMPSDVFSPSPSQPIDNGHLSVNGNGAANNNNNTRVDVANIAVTGSATSPVPPKADAIPSAGESWDMKRQSASLLDLKRQRAKERQERLEGTKSSTPVLSNGSGGMSNGNSAGTVANVDTFDDTRRRKYSNRYDVAVSDDDGAECCLLM